MVRNLARLAALVAIAAVAAGVYVIVHANVATHSSPSAHRHDGHHHRHHAGHHHATHAKPKSYTVKSGDTMSEIATKTGVPLATLETLNPSVNPNALQTGQRLRLRR